MNRIILILIGICLVVFGLYYAIQSGRPEPSAGRLDDILLKHRGQVLILLLGRDGCPGTAKATLVLDAYIAEQSREISVIRLDVPLPGEALKLSRGWTHAFPRFLDDGRQVSDQLEFFYYPTLYIFDREGDRRFVGGCDRDKLDLMIKEILAEHPGEKKKVYTIPQPAIGQAAPGLSATLLSDEAVSLKSLTGPKGLLIVFSRTSCPFSLEQLPLVKTLAGQIETLGVKTVIINQNEAAQSITSVYKEHCAGLPVAWDRDDAISQAYGVDAVPFFFLLGPDNKIVQRRSFTYDAALNAVEVMLGMSVEKNRLKTKSAG